MRQNRGVWEDPGGGWKRGTKENRRELGGD